MSNMIYTDGEFEPSLSYAGTSGNVNVDTSRDATTHADVSGITNKAQRYALILATQRGSAGVTVKELREQNGSVHHGRVSAALTNLHIAGRLVALTERRDHCGIYVLPEFVLGRETRTYHPNRKPIEVEDIFGAILDHRYVEASGRCHCGWMATVDHPSHNRHVAEKIAEALT